MSPRPRHALTLRARSARIIARVLAGYALDRARDEDRARYGRHGLVEELAIGTIRYAPRLLARVGPLQKQPFRPADRDLEALILMGIYQALFMDTPAAVAVSEAVAATEALGKPWGKGAANALLRAALAAESAEPYAGYNHPDWLVDRLRAAWPQAWRAVLAANDERAPLTLRVDIGRVARADYLKQLADAGIMAEAHPLALAAVVLAQGTQVAGLPGFSEGLVSVQDAGAQWAAPLLAPQPGDIVLDACAAPGGKTGHLAQIAPEARVMAVDSDPARVMRLQETVARLQCGAHVQVVTHDLTADPLTGRFQRILLDAPCSATGVIRRHPDIKLNRRVTDLPPLRAIQAQLLDRLWQNLAPGGTMMYVTCSVLPEENEDQVADFLARTPDASEHPFWLPAGHKRRVGWQLLPGDAGMDGFYYARLVRRG